MIEPWEVLKISRASFFRYKTSQRHLSLINDYIWFRSQGLTEKPWSQTHQKHSLYQLRKYFATYPIVSYWGVRTWLNGTFSQNKDRHAALSGFARFLRYEGHMDDVEYFKIRGLHPIRSPYDPVKQRLVSSADVIRIAQVSAVGLFLSETALRINEFSTLTPACLHCSEDPTKSWIDVSQGKGGKYRKVPFSRRAQTCEWAFHKSRYWWGKHIKDVSVQLEIDFSAHSLRHYRITQWANNPNIPIAVVQKWAGHNDLKTTQGYIHLNDDDALRAAFE